MEDIQIITSRENRRLQHFRKVRDGKVKDQIFLEGARLVEEAMGSGIYAVEALISEEFHNNPRGAAILEELYRRSVSISETSQKLIRGVADTINPQGIILLAARPRTGPFDTADADISRPFFLYLHEINDPSNVGAVFRTAEAAGVAGVFLSRGSADPFSPKALRSGLGANLRVPIWENAGLEQAVSWVKEMEGQSAAADTKGILSCWDYDWTGTRLLVLGSEAHGLTESELGFVDEIVRIPMKAQVESLNLAVAAAVILFEAERQRSIKNRVS